jgi:hypothetical protein
LQWGFTDILAIQLQSLSKLLTGDGMLFCRNTGKSCIRYRLKAHRKGHIPEVSEDSLNRVVAETKQVPTLLLGWTN